MDGVPAPKSGTARPYQVDVSDPGSVREAVQGAASDLGRPVVLVNCAGIGKFANAHDMAFEDWSRILAVNLTGTFLMSQAVLPHLLESGGNIVNVASNAGLMGPRLPSNILLGFGHRFPPSRATIGVQRGL
jgi:NAD(P)-dependent dehydrogenase (short-subunit alcohol dehydrogenase family)